MDKYESKANVTKISATSRVAIRLKDNYYTVEYSEERTIPDIDGVILKEEREALFDAVNAVVDAQAEDIVRSFSKKESTGCFSLVFMI